MLSAEIMICTCWRIFFSQSQSVRSLTYLYLWRPGRCTYVVSVSLHTATTIKNDFPFRIRDETQFPAMTIDVALNSFTPGFVFLQNLHILKQVCKQKAPDRELETCPWSTLNPNHLSHQILS